MKEMSQLEEDLGYVRRAVQKSEPRPSPRSIYLLWAAILLVGFALMDFRTGAVGLYWMTVAPAGFVISALLGWRHHLRLGQSRRGAGRVPILHWGATMGSIFLAVPLVVTGSVQAEDFGKVALVIMALGYFLAGVHLDRRLMGVGLLIAAGYLMLLILPSFSWTVMGLLLAVALAISAFWGGENVPAAEG